MSVSTNDLKNGMTLELDGTLFQVVEFQHVKPGKGGAFVRTKLRNIKTGGIVERTFNAGVKVGLAIVERKDMQYLYRDGESLTFMDMSSYEQIPVPAELVGDGANWLSEGSTAQVAMHQGTPIGVELPPSVTLAITTHGRQEISFGSRESESAPRLVVMTDDGELDDLILDAVLHY